MKQFLVGASMMLLAGCTNTISNMNMELSQTALDAPTAKYAAGVKSYFFRNENAGFDDWGKKYKTDEYRQLLSNIEAAGDVRTVHTNIYYPTNRSSELTQDLNILPFPLYAARDGQLATEVDFFEGNADLQGSLQAQHGMENPAGQRVIQRQSYKDATIADGQFPLIVMIHGLGGGHNTWNRAAEFMATQGYIVATIAYTSDSGSTPVFEDPASSYAKTRSPEELLQDYQLLHSGGTVVFSGFFRILYGENIEMSMESDFPDISALKAVKGGGIKAGKMMAELFEQRTEDLATVIRSISELNEQDSFFKGKVDVDNIGVMGHSLGSITTQSALVNIPEIKTAAAFNNGVPRSWEPYGGFPDKSGNVDKPDGVPKDILFVIGSDDNFVHMVFKEIFFKWYANAGGDIQETMPLPAEQLWPTEDNPQPVAKSAYERATARKMLLMFKDQGHATAVDDVTYVPGEILEGLRVPLDRNQNSFQAEKYNELGWLEANGKQVYLPHVMRNYFIQAWFDWQLKGQQEQRARLINHPFGAGVKLMLHSGIE